MHGYGALCFDMAPVFERNEANTSNRLRSPSPSRLLREEPTASSDPTTQVLVYVSNRTALRRLLPHNGLYLSASAGKMVLFLFGEIIEFLVN